MRPPRSVIERLEPRRLLAVVINEILADNTAGLKDQDGDRSDWIELRNTGASAVDVGGWHLTDDAVDPDKWTFPSPTILPPGGYLTVFASDKNRAVAGQELHTNFQLASAGEYLALVMPDGATIADSFDPFPAQSPDHSYGVASTTGTSSTVDVVPDGAPARVISPSAQSAATDDFWREIGFNDSAWIATTTGVGFDRDSSPNNTLLNYIATPLTTTQMPSTRLTAYVRVPFTVTDRAQLTSLQLQMRYDDGFIAYLNGKEILRENADNTIKPVWNQNARGTRLDATVANPTTYDLTPYLPLLVDGNNVLAVHGMNSNSSAENPDFLIDPILTAARATGPAAVRYMPTPTPGANNGWGTLGFVGDTHFSVDRGFFDAPFQVAITTDTPGASIRYTTDGSAPSETAGTLYSGPIDIATTTILRALAYKAGYVPSNVDTQTYIFLQSVIHQSGAGLPSFAAWGHDKDDADTLPGDADWDVDPDVVNNPTYAGTIKDDLKAIPSVSLVMNWNDLFGSSPQGIYPETTAWKASGVERATSIEYFNATGTEQWHLDGAVEVQGGSSDTRWNTDKLSLQLKFKFPYGSTKLSYPLFASAPFGAGATASFDTLLLDGQFNYTWLHSNVQQNSVARYVQDQVVSDYQNLLGSGVAPHGRFVHLYLNGLYWGLYNLHEKPGDSFAQQYFGGEKEDYDVIKHAATNWSDGGVTAVNNYAALLTAVRKDLTSLANYQAVEALLDVDDFIDYMSALYYAGNWDWGGDNWYASHNRVEPDAKWHFHSWDQEHAFPTNDNGDTFNVDYDSTTKNDTGGPTEIQQRLMAGPEYKLKFADHVQKHFFNGGQLTPAAAAAVYQARATEIDRAIVGESARWGDNRIYNTPYTRANFITTTNGVLANFFPQRTAIVVNQFTARGWLQSLAAPQFNHYGCDVPPGFSLSMAKPAGSPAGATIYYTLDGSDPRVPGTGAVGSSAIAYGNAITLSSSTRVKARIKDGSNWSAVIDATFIVAGAYPLRITELHYHPPHNANLTDDDDQEFIELLNTGSATISLQGVQLTEFTATPYVFGAGVNLAAGKRIVVARNPAVFQQVYGSAINLAPTGYGTANLSNSGERVALIGPLGEVLQDFIYDDVAPWPTAPDGAGPSLEIIDPLGEPSNPANWRASAHDNGSPGTSGVDTLAPTVVDSSVQYLAGATAVLVQFSEPIDLATLVAMDLSMQPIAGGASVAAGSVAYDDPTRTATFDFGTALSDDVWRATLAAGSVSDYDANATATPYTLDFVLVNTGQTFALPAGTTSVNQLVIGAGSAKLDLGTSTLIVDYAGVSPYAAINAQIVSGRNGGAWNGGGIVTSAANSSFTTLGVAEASQVLGIAGTQTAVFAGQAVDATGVLVKYTYGGDANLDGKINVDDYGRIDFNVALDTTGWFNGDFNYDGKINVDDYGIIDFNVAIQGPPLSSTDNEPTPTPPALSLPTKVMAPLPETTDDRDGIDALLSTTDLL